MKIDEESINHNIVRIAKDCTSWIIDANAKDESDLLNVFMSMARLQGAIELGDYLKEVLKE